MDILAVSSESVVQWGCPYCGYRSGYSPISGGGTSVVVCGECSRSFAVLAPGVLKSTIGFGELYPELSEHPRKGTPSHGTQDKRPEGGGEFFRSRGIGLDSCVCFVCGTSDRDGKGHCMLNNIAAFVVCKEAGERVVAMFAQGARLDYRKHEPDYVQVKIGACDAHLPNLKALDELTGKADGVITAQMIQEAWCAGTAATGGAQKGSVSVRIVGSSIQPSKGWPFQEEPGFELRIDFDSACVPVASTKTHKQYGAYCRAVGGALAVVASPDCAHFFDAYVVKFFLTQEDAETALAEVKKLGE